MIVEGFGGPGGWSEGLRRLGLADIAIEWDRWACATRRAAGHPVIQADVAEYPPERFAGAEGAIFSPPCPAFSKAGKREGIVDIPKLLDHLHACRDGWRPAVGPWAHPHSPLVLEPLRWVSAVGPEWVACEQVPDVLPAWEATASTLRAWGYSTWCGVLCAADYGVPQTRERAILMASRARAVAPPEPTHSDQRRSPSLFHLPWVSMAEALGWGMTDRPYLTVACSSDTGGMDKEKVGGSGARRVIYAEQEAGRWAWDRPATTVCGDPRLAPPVHHGKGMNSHGQITSEDMRSWAYDRPATTVVGSFRPDIVAAPGYRQAGDGPRQNAPGSIKVELWELGVLQDFPPDYPWQGNKSQRGQQIGNAWCPSVAAAIVGTLTGIDWVSRLAGYRDGRSAA